MRIQDMRHSSLTAGRSNLPEKRCWRRQTCPQHCQWNTFRQPERKRRMKERKAGERMRKRNHVIPVRLNAKELRLLDEQVKRSGLSREEFLRSLIVGAEVRAKPCEHHADLLRKVAGLCNNANQLAHVANAAGRAETESVREMLRISKEVWQIVKEEW